MDYYNEIDGYKVEWLRNLIAEHLIPQGEVDERSITEVDPRDLSGYEQCHFFAGIGGWPLALKLAGWSGPVWTGSCPCQPFSSAARGRGRRFTNKLHLWPTWRNLIASARPGLVFGEQISQANAWHSIVGDDLERLGYAFGSAVLPACGFGFDHARQRFFFVGHANREGESGGAINGEVARLSRYRSQPRDVVRANGLSSRMATLRAFGDAIVPQIAAEFVRACADAIIAVEQTGEFEAQCLEMPECASKYPEQDANLSKQNVMKSTY